MQPLKDARLGNRFGKRLLNTIPDARDTAYEETKDRRIGRQKVCLFVPNTPVGPDL